MGSRHMGAGELHALWVPPAFRAPGVCRKGISSTLALAVRQLLAQNILGALSSSARHLHMLAENEPRPLTEHGSVVAVSAARR